MKQNLRGFSLIELVVALVIMGVLLSLALPSFSNYIRDSRVRASAEIFLSGIQLARSEAVRRNTQVEFILTASAPTAANVASATASANGANWMIRTTDLATFIEGKYAVDGGGSGGNAVTVSSLVSSITFNGLGRTSLAADTDINFGNAQGTCQTDGGTVRCLRVAISMFGQARLCDPKAAAGDTRRC